jgi:beta-lactamase class A
MSMAHASRKQTLDELLAAYPGNLAFLGENISTGRTVGWHEDRTSATASCIKLFVLAAMFAEAENGSLSLDERVSVSASDRIGGSGVLKHLSAGVEMNWHDLATLMIVLSDNVATNMVIDRIGIQTINSSIRALGFGSTHLINRIDFDAIGSDIEKLAVSTPADGVRCMRRLAEGRLVSQHASARMIEILSRQHYVDLLLRKLPYDPYARDLGHKPTLTVAGKTGFFPGFRGDVVLIEQGENRVVMAAFATGEDKSFSPDNTIAHALGEIGLAAFDHLTAS